jgi:PAS domain S-box-containing protein
MARKSGKTAEKVRKRAGRPRRQRPADQGQFPETDSEKLDRRPQTVQRNTAHKSLRGYSKDLERRVQQQTAQLRLQAEAISHLAEGVVITEGSKWSSSTILFVNRAMRRITGYAADGLIRCPRWILFGKDTNREDLNRINQKLSKGEACRVEVVNYRKDGTPYDAELSIVPLSRSNGVKTTFVSIHRDITERKKAEQQLEQYKKSLQRMSSELMLAEEAERQRLAEDLHDSLGQSLFRARIKLDQMSSRAPELVEIAKDLEDVGKIVNTLTFELSPPVLRQLGVKAALRWLGRHITDRYGVTIQVNDDERAVALDPRITVVLFRCVRELAINVAKHAQSKFATISLKALRHSFQIIVEDRGKGFDLAEQTGLVENGHFGLFSVRERLEYLGGNVKIRSTPGKGTRVTITVPTLCGT